MGAFQITPPGETITATERWNMLSSRGRAIAVVAAIGAAVLLVLAAVTIAARPPVDHSTDIGQIPGYADCVDGWFFAQRNDQTGGRTMDQYVRECLDL